MYTCRVFRLLLISSIMTMLYALPVMSQEVKTISGMSIIGNNEAPKSLYIVPWKSSEIGMKTDLSSNLLNESLTPVDRDVFLREVDFYNASKGTR